MKSSLRREKVKWARRGGHALPNLGLERGAPATDCGETPAAADRLELVTGEGGIASQPCGFVLRSQWGQASRINI
jgi:hypothetical protein